MGQSCMPSLSAIIGSSTGIELYRGLYPFEEWFSTCSKVSNSQMKN